MWYRYSCTVTANSKYLGVLREHSTSSYNLLCGKSFSSLDFFLRVAQSVRSLVYLSVFTPREYASIVLPGVVKNERLHTFYIVKSDTCYAVQGESLSVVTILV